MSTTTRHLGLTGFGEPLARGRAVPKRWRTAFGFLTLAKARPGLTAIGLAVVYLLALTALAMVLVASMLNTGIGVAVVLVFTALMLLFTTIGVYVVLPEREVGAAC